MNKSISNLFVLITVIGFCFTPFWAGAASLITGAGSGGGPHVRSFDLQGQVESNPAQLMAYADTYRDGVRVATGDIDFDGADEIITGTGENGGSHLRVFEKDGTQRGIEFFPFDERFRGGMDVAAGDFDGDGKEDIAVSQFSAGQAWVKVYKYNDARTILFERNVFGTPECGATVAMGQLDNDAAQELIVGSGSGCGTHVITFDYNAGDTRGTQKPINFHAFAGQVRGVDVAAADIDGDGKDEIATSSLVGETTVKVFRYRLNEAGQNPAISSWYPYGEGLAVGANIEMADVDYDGQAEVIVGAGSGGGPHVRAFEYNGELIDSVDFFAYDKNFRGGVDVAMYDGRPDLGDSKTYANAYKSYTDADLQTLKRFDIVTIEPFDIPDSDFVTKLKKAGTIVLAYVSLGEVSTYRDYWDELDESVILAPNPNWPNSYYANVNDSAWHDVLLNSEIPNIFQQGDFDGLMLDTIDAVDVYPSLKPGMIELVGKIRAAYPDRLIMPNRGFSILPEIADDIDAIKHEGACATYDFDADEYGYVTNDNQMDVIDEVLSSRDMPILVLDHVDTATAVGEQMARACYAQAQEHERETGYNFVWYANALTQDLPVWDWLPF